MILQRIKSVLRLLIFQEAKAMRQEVTPQVQENNCTKAKVQLLLKKTAG